MPTDVNTIKSYDEQAKKWASRIRSGENIAHAYLEKPAMYAKLPDLHGKSVLCVGCGTGEECEHLKSLGADKVIGIDISSGLIEVAKQSYPALEFHVMDMEKIDFPAGSFDYIYCSLTMHYVSDWRDTLTGINRVMKNDAICLFSTHHPIKWGAQVKRGEDEDSFIMGYIKNKKDEGFETYGDYLNTRKITDTWFGEMEVSYYHKPLSEIFSEMRECGFEIIDFVEPKPTEVAKEKKPNFWNIHQKIPLFIIFEIKKVSWQ